MLVNVFNVFFILLIVCVQNRRTRLITPAQVNARNKFTALRVHRTRSANVYACNTRGRRAKLRSGNVPGAVCRLVNRNRRPYNTTQIAPAKGHRAGEGVTVAHDEINNFWDPPPVTQCPCGASGFVLAVFDTLLYRGGGGGGGGHATRVGRYRGARAPTRPPDQHSHTRDCRTPSARPCAPAVATATTDLVTAPPPPPDVHTHTDKSRARVRHQHPALFASWPWPRSNYSCALPPPTSDTSTRYTHTTGQVSRRAPIVFFFRL